MREKKTKQGGRARASMRGAQGRLGHGMGTGFEPTLARDSRSVARSQHRCLSAPRREVRSPQEAARTEESRWSACSLAGFRLQTGRIWVMGKRRPTTAQVQPARMLEAAAPTPRALIQDVRKAGAAQAAESTPHRSPLQRALLRHPRRLNSAPHEKTIAHCRRWQVATRRGVAGTRWA